MQIRQFSQSTNVFSGKRTTKVFLFTVCVFYFTHFSASKGNTKMSGFVQLEILRGEDLPKKDWCASDPYVIVTFGGGSNTQEKQSAVRSNTLNPVWNQTFQLKTSNECDKLDFVLYDHDVLGEHDYMCEGYIWIGTPSKLTSLIFADDKTGDDMKTKLTKLRQLGVSHSEPAGNQSEATIHLFDKQTNTPAGKLYIRWVYSYSYFGGMLTARLEELSLEGGSKLKPTEEFSFDILQGNIKRIKGRISDFLRPLDYIGSLLAWENPAESCIVFLLVLFLLKKGLLLSFIPFSLTLGMLRNWYLWWRWGPAGPPRYELIQPDDIGNDVKTDNAQSVDESEFILVKLQRLGSDIQIITGNIVATLDSLHDILMWKRPRESATITIACTAVALVLAIPYIGTVLGAVVVPAAPYVSTLGIIYLFTLYPIYKQFPYIAKYYQVGDLIGLLICNLTLSTRWLPAWLGYNSTMKEASAHLKKNISVSMLTFLSVLDSGNTAASLGKDLFEVLDTSIFPSSTTESTTTADTTIHSHEQYIIHSVLIRGTWSIDIFHKQTDPDAGVYRLKSQIQKDVTEQFDNPILATKISDAIKKELASRTVGGLLRREDRSGKLIDPPLWLPVGIARQLNTSRKVLIDIELERASREACRARDRKYSDSGATKPRLTVNILSCKNLKSACGEVKRLSSRITWVKATISGHSFTSEKKKHPTAPQFYSQLKFGFDPYGRDSINPTSMPYLRIELFEEGKSAPLGWFDIDIRRLPRRAETPEKYYPLRRLGNDTIGELAVSLFAEGFGTEKLMFDPTVATRLSYDKVLQRMYWESISQCEPCQTISDTVVDWHPEVSIISEMEHLPVEGSDVQMTKTTSPIQPKASSDESKPPPSPKMSASEILNQIESVKQELKQLTEQTEQDQVQYDTLQATLSREIKQEQQKERSAESIIQTNRNIQIDDNSSCSGEEFADQLQSKEPSEKGRPNEDSHAVESEVAQVENNSNLNEANESSPRPQTADCCQIINTTGDIKENDINQDGHNTSEAITSQQQFKEVRQVVKIGGINERKDMTTVKTTEKTDSCETTLVGTHERNTNLVTEVSSLQGNEKVHPVVRMEGVNGGGAVPKITKSTERKSAYQIPAPTSLSQRVLDEVARITDNANHNIKSVSTIDVQSNTFNTSMMCSTRGYFCDGCQSQYLRNARYNSLVDDNYDLCESCYREQVLLQIITPTDFRRVSIPVNTSTTDYSCFYDPATGLSKAELSLARYEAAATVARVQATNSQAANNQL